MSTTATPTTPTTLLEAINELLRAVRISPVASLLAADTNQDAADAKAAIDTAALEVLNEGWEFNTDYEMTLAPGVTGEVSVPANTLDIRKSRTESGSRLVLRGSRFYDNINHTYKIGAAVIADIVVGLEFSEMPPLVRKYVVALAARRFCIPKLPSGATFRYTEEYLLRARNEAMSSDQRGYDGTLDQTSPHFFNMRRR